MITGFRVAYGGAQERYGVTPDLTCLGKIIGGGLPVGAYGGRREVMEQVAPLGPVYQAGTLSGNPIAVAAGIATLQALQRPDTYELLEQRAAALAEGFAEAARQCRDAGDGEPGGLHAHPLLPPGARPHVGRGRAGRRRRLQPLLPRHAGAGRLPRPVGRSSAAFVSLAHTEEDIEATVAAAHRVLGGGR